jgi:cation:H+ antiporter
MSRGFLVRAFATRYYRPAPLTMTTSVLMLLLGGCGLYFGAEWLVRGSAGLARSFGVRPLVVGLTVVAYGTSAPELVVSCTAALEGKSAVVLGNVVGSNIANLGLILGVTALVSPPHVERGLIFRELPVLLAATAAVPLLLADGVIGRVDGAVLVALAASFTVWLVLAGRSERGAAANEATEHPESMGRLALAGVGALGLAVLLVGGKTFVDGAVALALLAGMSERVVGLTIVAVGTSLPEMAASLVAALRGQSGIAVGNVVGSNIFNVLLVLGGAGLIAPVAGSLAELRLDLAVLVGLTLVGIVSLRTERTITRAEGVLLVAAYAAFLAALAVG